MRKNLYDSRPKFVPHCYDFDPFCDMQEVEQFGFTNIAECFEKGILPGGLEMTDETFNGVQNPGTLISRSMDVFDGLRKRDYVRLQLDRLNAEEREKFESAMNRQAEHEGASSVQVSSEG